MEYVINRSISTGDRLTRSVEMPGYPRAYATEAEARADYNQPRAKCETFRMLRWFGDKPGEFRLLSRKAFG